MKKELPHEQITYLESDQNYTVIHYKDGSQITHGYTLKVFQEKLPKVGFRRIHRKYLVNERHVRHHLGYSVMLKSGVELPVSRRRRG